VHAAPAARHLFNLRSTPATSVMSSGQAAAVPPAFSMSATVSRAPRR
jgi:hypothetical protein